MNRPAPSLPAQPLYLFVAEALADRIASGALAPGTQLLSERDLCKQFKVSRVTVRRALAELRDRGQIEPDIARGWFVQAPTLGEPNALMSFTEMARSRGLAATSTVLRADVRPASIDEAEDLRIAPSLRHADLAGGSLYEALRGAGVIPAFSEYVLQAIAASDRQAALLDLPEGAPLLMASAITHDRAGKPIEISRSVFRGDRYRFHTTLFRPGQEPIR